MNELKSADGAAQPATVVCTVNACPTYVPVSCEYLGCTYQPGCDPFHCTVYL